ncbi:hypothetical protein ACIBVL_11570 [Streptomyces sp. NPDC049687]|uniref:hypothetical protein n=1 Tax=Streptomyces sp. NPDC049687 TaxID=3365596 RepID=UPI003798EB43
MLFSIPESGWWLIAVAATVFFMISMPALAKGMKLPDEMRSTLERNRTGRWAFYLLTPVAATAVLATNLLRPEPAPAILFLYSVAFASIPIALFPVRARMLKDYIAQQQNPDIKIKLDRLTMAWVAGFLSTVLLVAVLALMATSYGDGN